MMLTAVLAFVGATGAGAACLHGDGETAEQQARRREAVQVVRHVNTMEHMGLEKARRFVPLGQVPGVKAPDGFHVSLVSDGKDYIVTVKDTRDPCGFAFVSDSSGLIYEAQFISDSLGLLRQLGATVSPSRTPDPIVGSWRLVSQEERRDDGTVVAVWGADPGGRLVYDAGGRMAVQLMNRQRKPFAAPDRLAGTAEELRDAFAGFIAYYGSYSVDPAAGVVVHHVEGALFPNWIGTDLRRSFRLDGRRLQLSTPPMLVGGRTSTFVLVWERED
jgi:hypothetical protein